MTDINTEQIEVKEEQYSSINELVVVGEFGFHRIEGPHLVEKDGTVWEVTIDGVEPDVGLIEPHIGESATLVVDGRTIGGGIVVSVSPRDDGAVVMVDQYAMGDSV